MNHRNPGIKRILADVKELQKHPSNRYHAAPLESNMFEWHFTIRGAKDTDFEGGIYHGRILLPSEYPFKPPNIVFMTKNGRFEVGTKICLSISAYHEETWQPAWGVRTMLEAIISFMPTEGNGAIGALDWTKEERQKLAKESHNFNCPLCGPISKLLPEYCSESEAKADQEKGVQKEEQFDEEIQAQIRQLHMGRPAASASQRIVTLPISEETNEEETKPQEPGKHSQQVTDHHQKSNTEVIEEKEKIQDAQDVEKTKTENEIATSPTSTIRRRPIAENTSNQTTPESQARNRTRRQQSSGVRPAAQVHDNREVRNNVVRAHEERPLIAPQRAARMNDEQRQAQIANIIERERVAMRALLRAQRDTPIDYVDAFLSLALLVVQVALVTYAMKVMLQNL